MASASGGLFSGLNRDSILDSVRTTIAAVAAMLLAHLLKLPEFYWALISAIVIIQSTIPPLTLGWQRFVGTALGAVLAATLATFFHPNPAVYALGILVLRFADISVARGKRLSLCRNCTEYSFADSARASSVDHRMASFPRSLAGDCRSAGNDNDLAVDDRKTYSLAEVFMFLAFENASRRL